MPMTSNTACLSPGPTEVLFLLFLMFVIIDIFIIFISPVLPEFLVYRQTFGQITFVQEMFLVDVWVAVSLVGHWLMFPSRLVQELFNLEVVEAGDTQGCCGLLF